MTSSSEDEFLGDAVIEDKRTSKKVIKTRAGRESHPPLRYCEESDSDCSKQHVAAKKTPTVTAVVGSQGTWLKPISGRTLESDSVLTKRILEHVSHVAEPFSEKPSDLIPEKVETVSLTVILSIVDKSTPSRPSGTASLVSNTSVNSFETT